ncbi:MAG: AI-2E family transporter [Cyanobacteria bacterium P01_A01_bin.45]
MSPQRKALTITDLFLIIATFFLVILLWQLRGLLLTLMIAVVIASAISPIVDKAQQLKIPRWLGVILVYLGLIASLVGVGLIIGPSVSIQIQRLISKLPAYLDSLANLIEDLALRLGIDQLEVIEQIFDIQTITNWIFRSSQKVVSRSFGVTFGILGTAINLFLAVIISGYMVAGSKDIIQGLVSLFPYPWNERLNDQVTPISRRVGGYIQGRVLVSGILGILITVCLGFLGLSEFALALGVIAGFTNLIPFVGPVLGAIPALIVAIPQSGLTFLWVLLLFVIIQNLESYVLDPLLVGSSVKVHPLYQLLAVVGGTQVLGIVGAIIVPPWIAGLAVVLENLYLKPKLLTEIQELQESSSKESQK